MQLDDVAAKGDYGMNLTRKTADRNDLTLIKVMSADNKNGQQKSLPNLPLFDPGPDHVCD